jgi:hypothetical protein
LTISLVGWATKCHIVSLAAALLASSFARAATIEELDVQRDGGCYRLSSVTYVDAALDAVFQVLTDYDAFQRISSVYEESRFLAPHPDGTPIVYTRMKGCLLFFCTSMRRVERLETDPPSFIRTTVLPEQSDVAYGQSEWILEPEAGGTRVTHRLTMQPDFWVPPVLGPWLLRKSLRKHGAAAVDRIEELAAELSPRRGRH